MQIATSKRPFEMFFMKAADRIGILPIVMNKHVNVHFV